MANNFASNITPNQLIRIFLEKFNNARVLTKNVNTQLLDGVFNPTTGTNVRFKRPTDYTTKRTSDGDVSAGPPADIITGSATGTVQDYFTVDMEYSEFDESLNMDQIEQLLETAATRIVTDFELDFGQFMLKNTGLLSGTVGTAADTWADVAGAGAIMQASGIPMDERWAYAVNPFTQVALADTNVSLGAGGAVGSDIRDSLANATIREQFAGMRVMTATTLGTYITGTGADRAGTIASDPDVTYLAAKDTMTQTIAVTAFQANLVVKAGETLTISGRNRLNLSTRQPVINAAGGSVLFSGTVNEDVTLGASGEGDIVITGPAIFEATGAYNTVDSAPVTGDVVTLGGLGATQIQPNLFWHPQAFSVGSIPIKRLSAQDTFAETEDGLQIRMTRGSSILENKQIVRYDFHPAYAALNPFFAGQGFGAP